MCNAWGCVEKLNGLVSEYIFPVLELSLRLLLPNLPKVQVSYNRTYCTSTPKGVEVGTINAVLLLCSFCFH